MGFKIRMINRKRELKQPDEFVSTVDRLADAMRVYRMYALGIFVLIVFIAGAVGGVLWYQIKQEEWAAVLELEAADFYHRSAVPRSGEGVPSLRDDNLRFAIEGYQKVVEEYPRTRSAAVSQYYIGNSYLELGDYDQAILAYEEFLRRYSDRPFLLSLARQRLASAFVGQGNVEAAQESLKGILSLQIAYNRDRALFDLGELSESQGKKEAAIESYQRILQDHPNSILAAESQIKLRGLGVESEGTSESEERMEGTGEALPERPEEE